MTDPPPTTRLEDDTPALARLAAAVYGPVTPDYVGPYRIIRQLGEGGFGVVYLAEQEVPLRREVALKVIKPGMDTRAVVRRFEAERQTLARLNHPGVARVLDAGSTEADLPFFVMELVEGEPITRFCDRHEWPTFKRLELFLQVCQAVQHAHGKGVIHRDLKPSNVLVTLVGDRPQAKVIDFGVARALEPDAEANSLMTVEGQVVGTPQYMSPEQAQGRLEGIDTRTDVYALGVLLYELLTGTLPFDKPSNADAPRPSVRLATLAPAEASRVAACRQTDVSRLRRQLAGELAWLPLKAMRREPEARYRTAAEMGDDVANYLAGRPLVAGPESRVYRLKKFARRNRGGVAAAAAVALAVLAGVVGTVLMAVQADRQRAEAERQRVLAEARFDDVRELATDWMFRMHRELKPLAGSTAAVKMLVDTSLEYLTKLDASLQADDDPTLRIELARAYILVGDILGDPTAAHLGRSREAREQFTRALELLEPLDEADPEVALRKGDALRKLAANLEIAGDQAAALAAIDRALAIWVRRAEALADGPGQPDAHRAVYVGHVVRGGMKVAGGDLPGAAEDYARAAEIADAIVAAAPNRPQAHEDQAIALYHLGLIDLALGSPEEADAHLSACVTIVQKLIAAFEHNVNYRRRLALALAKHAQVAQRLNDLPRAERLIEDSLAQTRLLAEASPLDTRLRRDLAIALQRLGDVRIDLKDPAGAMTAYREFADIADALLTQDPDSKDFLDLASTGWERMGRAHHEAGRPAEAIPNLLRTREIRRRLAAEDPADAQLAAYEAFAVFKLAQLHREAGRPEDALSYYDEAIALRLALFDRHPEPWLMRRNACNLLLDVAEVNLDLARLPDAADALHRAATLESALFEADGDHADGHGADVTAHRMHARKRMAGLHLRLADLGNDAANRRRLASADFRHALKAYETLKASDHLMPEETSIGEQLQAALKQLEAAD